MEWINLSINFGATYVEQYVCYALAAIILNHKEVDKKVRLTAGVGALLVIVGNVSHISPFIVWATSLLYTMIVVYWRYHTELAVVWGITSIYFVCLGSMDFIVLMGVTIFCDNDQLEKILQSNSIEKIIIVIVIKVVWIVGYLILKRVLKKYSIENYT